MKFYLSLRLRLRSGLRRKEVICPQLTQPLFLSSLTLASETDWATIFRALRRSTEGSDRP